VKHPVTEQRIMQAALLKVYPVWQIEQTLAEEQVAHPEELQGIQFPFKNV